MLFKRKFPITRRSRRQWLNSKVELFTGCEHMQALGVNVSEGGLCLFAVADLPVGSELEVAFRPPWSREPVRVCGRVRHRALYLYGIEFVGNGEIVGSPS
jgi:hypothetical protein